jgi:potassium/hydrogen antiporter
MDLNSIIIVAILLILSVLISKISDRFGVPALLLFLFLGMAAGSEGIGGIYFDNPQIAQTISIVALILILYSGGMQTRWREVKGVVIPSFSLATIGVLITAVVVGWAASYLLDISFLEGLLLGSMMSSTDAAAVFSVLRSKGVNLKGNLKPFLELESGSNDPMAVFLTVGTIQLILIPDASPLQLIPLFFQQMVLGGLIGYVMGRISAFTINRIKLGYEGLYPVLSLAFVLLTFGLANLINGSAFLAVYILGIVVNNVDIVHKRTIQKFHDGLAWLLQITMFLVLGLFIFPSQLIPVFIPALLIALILILVARPTSIFLTLLPFKFAFKKKLFVSWVGLRGAAPIILATFPMLAGIDQSNLFFNVVFFVVLTSVLFQGTTIPIVAKLLKLDAPLAARPDYPFEYRKVAGMDSQLYEIDVPAESEVVDQSIIKLKLPDNLLVILIEREQKFLVPYGGTVIKGGDTLLVLSDKDSLIWLVESFKLIVKL